MTKQTEQTEQERRDFARALLAAITEQRTRENEQLAARLDAALTAKYGPPPTETEETA